jgi:hypothetical protein
MPTPQRHLIEACEGVASRASKGQVISRLGDTISFRAKMDAVAVFSACPQDMVPINGRDCVVRDAHFELEP